MKTQIAFVKNSDDLIEVDMEEEIKDVATGYGYKLHDQGYDTQTKERGLVFIKSSNGSKG